MGYIHLRLLYLLAFLILSLALASACNSPDCDFAQQRIIFLNVTKQVSFEKFIDLQITKETTTRFKVCYKLNESLKSNIDTCNALLSASKLQCFSNLKANYSKDVSSVSFDTSLSNLADYKKEALTSNLRITGSVDLDKGGCFSVDLLNYDSKDLSKSIGEKFSIGYNTLELTTIETTNNVGNWPKIAVGSNGIVHIIHYDNTNSRLRYCNNSGGSWTCLNITDTNAINNAYGMSAAIDGNNVVHVLFRGTSACLGYGNNSGGVWTFNTTLACGSSAGSYNSIDIDKNNVIHVAYYDDGSASDLKYGNNSGGVWSFVNTPDKWLGNVNQIVVDSSNIPHIIAQSTDAPFRLVYLNYSAGVWLNKTINGTSTDSLYESLDIGNNDVLHTIFYSNDDGTSGLRCGNNSGGSWTFADIPTAPQYSSIYKSLRVDSRGIVNFITANATDLYACNNYNNAWACYPLSIAEPTTAYADLAIKQGRRVDSTADSNFFHFAYYDSANGDLVYANIAVNSSQTSPANNSYKNTNTLTFNCTSQFDLMPLKNVTAYVWNSSSLVNNSKTNTISGTSNSSLFSIILPRDDVYTWNCYSCIASGDCFFSDYNFTISTDTLYPRINITYPINTTYTSRQTTLNYTIAELHPKNCWWSNNSGSTNYSITCGTNITTNSTEGSNTWKVYINDSAGNINSSSRTFFVDSINPSVIINASFLNGSFINYNTSIEINLTISDSNLNSCWYNDNNTANVSFACGTNLSLNLSEQLHILSFFANDSLNNVNNTEMIAFTPDVTFPLMPNSTIATSVNSQTFSFNVNASDLNLDSCWYSVYNSSGGVVLGIENKSVNCSSVANYEVVDGWSTYTLRLYVNDSANNQNYSNTPFTTTYKSTQGGGGSGLDFLSLLNLKYPIVSLLPSPNKSTSFSELQRAIIFSVINNCCKTKVSPALSVINYYQECSLGLEDLNSIEETLKSYSINLPKGDIVVWYGQYKDNQLSQGYATKDQITKYNLVESFVSNPLVLYPSFLDKIFIVPGDSVLRYTFKANKPLISCQVLSPPEMSCEVIPNSSTVEIQYNVTSMGLSQVYQGQIGVTSEDKETRYAEMILRAYNLNYVSSYTMNLPVFIAIPVYFFLLITIALILGYVFKGKSPKNLKRFFRGYLE